VAFGPGGGPAPQYAVGDRSPREDEPYARVYGDGGVAKTPRVAGETRKAVGGAPKPYGASAPHIKTPKGAATSRAEAVGFARARRSGDPVSTLAEGHFFWRPLAGRLAFFLLGSRGASGPGSAALRPLSAPYLASAPGSASDFYRPTRWSP
jgi:hypothetical protein